MRSSLVSAAAFVLLALSLAASPARATLVLRWNVTSDYQLSSGLPLQAGPCYQTGSGTALSPKYSEVQSLGNHDPALYEFFKYYFGFEPPKYFQHTGQGFKINGSFVPAFYNPASCSAQSAGYTKWYSSATWESPVHPDLLKVGQNTLYYKNSCYLPTVDKVTLATPASATELYLVPCWQRLQAQAQGQLVVPGFEHTETIALTLAEVDPQLYQQIQRLLDSIGERLTKMKARLDQAAAKQAGLAQEIAKIEQLKLDTKNLLDQGFDKLTPAALDALLQQYDAINPDLRKELVQLVQDLKKQLAKLQAEVAAALAKFRTRMLAVDDLVKQAAQIAGAYGQELEKLDPLADFDDSGDIDVPSILGTSGFDKSHDPYGGYADEVLDQLSSTVSNGKVVDRETFLDIVDAWRLNQEALMSALLLKKDVASAEYEAFLEAQKRVVTYLRSHMDEGYWFLDSDVPQDVRAWLDSKAFKRFKQLAIDLKRALNLMPKLQGGERGRLHATLRGLMGMHRASVDYTVLLPTEGLAEIERAWRETVLRIKSFTTTVASMVPFLGAYIALCEFASGDEGCIDGVKLSTGQRALALASILPFGKAIGHVASAAGGLAVKAGIKGKMIIAGIVDLAVPARRALAKRLRKLDPKAVDNLTVGLTGKEIVNVLDTWGDDVVEAVAKKHDGAFIAEIRKWCI